MSLILDLPKSVDDRLERTAAQRGVAKESLAIDLLTRSLENPSASSPRLVEHDFWAPLDIDELAAEQGVKPITDFAAWMSSRPNIEGADELVAAVEQSRRERRQADRDCP